MLTHDDIQSLNVGLDVVSKNISKGNQSAQAGDPLDAQRCYAEGIEAILLLMQYVQTLYALPIHTCSRRHDPGIITVGVTPPP